MILEPASFTDPPYEPDCRKCDGTRKLEVAKVLACDGEVLDWPGDVGDQTCLIVPAVEVDCPWCAT